MLLNNRVPDCLQKRYQHPNNVFPFILQKRLHCEEATGMYIVAIHFYFGFLLLE